MKEGKMLVKGHDEESLTEPDQFKNVWNSHECHEVMVVGKIQGSSVKKGLRTRGEEDGVEWPNIPTQEIPQIAPV